MRYYKCKCGSLECFGSDSPFKCSWCDKCNSTPAGHPNGHLYVRTIHLLKKHEVKTDDGIAYRSYCIYCHQPKDRLEKEKEPYEYYKEQVKGNEGS